MLIIAYYRRRFKEYEDSQPINSLIRNLDVADCIVAPIADNRMFQIIDSFINGEITDEQCKHCLAATNLGYQTKRMGDNKIGKSKIKIAIRCYRGKGQHIDEIL